MAFQRPPQPFRADPQVAGGNQDTGVVLSDRPEGARFPEREGVRRDFYYTTAEVGAILFSHTKHPASSAWRWIRTRSIPDGRAGSRLRVLGESILAELQDRGAALRKAKRQRSLRRAS